MNRPGLAVTFAGDLGGIHGDQPGVGRFGDAAQACLVVAVNIVTDLVYVLLDPRIQVGS